jgi:hypothetical protein
VSVVVVFIGPSLPLHEARQILPDAVFLPPARQADVVSAVGTYRPDVLGLVDGVFGQSLSVWHKEILFALEQGVQVFGAASMGALRAAELAPFGMQGVGEIFRLFCSGELTDDDEVALVHAPAEAGFRPLSHAMVNVRATLEHARDVGLIAPDMAQRLIDKAKQLHFTDRTLPNILAGARHSRAVTDDLRQFFSSHYVDVKAADARQLLLTISRLDQAHSAARAMVRTRGFEHMCDNDRTVRHAGVDIPLGSIAAHAALHEPDFDMLAFNAMNRVLVQVLADRLGIEPTEAELAEEEIRFLRRWRLTGAKRERWLEANDLSPVEFQRLVRELAVCRRLQRWLMDSPLAVHQTRWLLDELRLRDRYAETANDTASDAALIGPGPDESDSVAELDEPALLDLLRCHQRSSGWSSHSPLKTWVQEAGFKDFKDLAYELLRAQRLREKRDCQPATGQSDHAGVPPRKAE